MKRPGWKPYHLTKNQPKLPFNLKPPKVALLDKLIIDPTPTTDDLSPYTPAHSVRLWDEQP